MLYNNSVGDNMIKNRKIIYTAIIFISIIVAGYAILNNLDYKTTNNGKEIIATKWLYLIAPGISLISILGINGLAKIDPKDQSSNLKVIFITSVSLGIVPTFYNLIVILDAYNDFAVSLSESLLMGMIGLMFIPVGIGMYDCKQSYFIGLKTPWTLNNKVSWKETHRKGAVLFVLLGIATFITSVFTAVFELSTLISAFVVAGGAIIITIYLIIYSHRVYKANGGKQNG